MAPNDDRFDGLSNSAQERLIGLLLILGGVVGFGVVYLLWLFAPAAILWRNGRDRRELVVEDVAVPGAGVVRP